MTGILTVKELYEELKHLVYWEQFAIHLPGITSTNIEVIKRDQPNNVDDQKLALFRQWLRRTPKTSWKHVIDALEAVGENRYC